MRYPGTHFTFLRILLGKTNLDSILTWFISVVMKTLLMVGLCKYRSRNYVVQYLIEQKVSASKLLIQFRMHYAELATQKFSSHVMEKCLRIYPEARAEIVRELLSVPNFEHLLHDPFGNYVILTALSVTKVSSKSN